MRMRRPMSSRTGMFCKLGFVDERRPVAVTAWLNEVWMRPVERLTSWGSAST